MNPNAIPAEAFWAIGGTVVLLLAIWCDYLIQHRPRVRWMFRLVARLARGRWRL